MAKKVRNRNSEAAIAANNFHAIQEGPKQKRWNGHDLKRVTPLTENQEDLFQAWFQGDHICAYGSAGTGKTFLALYLAMLEVFERKIQNRIILVRSVVPTRDIGHLPGTVEEKTAVYELPYHDICHELVGRPKTYQDMKDAGKIEFMITSYIRGLTWDNAVIVVDEFQNMTPHEIDSIMTRVGENTRVILCGDANNQMDVKREQSGAGELLRIAKRMDCFSEICFTKDDIVRSAFVKAWITARELET